MYNGRLPLLQTLQQFVSPKAYAAKVLAGHRLAWGKLGLPGKDALFIADVDAGKSILASELQPGVGADWPPTFCECQPPKAAPAAGSTSTGSSSSITAEASTEQPQLAGISTTPDGRMLLGYPAVRMLTFDVLVNRVLGLRMSDAEVQTYAGLFEKLVDGFVPPAWDLPFTPYGKGLQAR